MFIGGLNSDSPGPGQPQPNVPVIPGREYTPAEITAPRVFEVQYHIYRGVLEKQCGGFNEDRLAWCELPDTKHLPVEISLNLLDALHERMVHLLRSVPPANFQRSIYHPENGPMTLDAVVSLYAWHGQHHTAHVTALRKREGWS